MIVVTTARPNSIGQTSRKEWDSYPEEWIERQCEKLADKGWELTELAGSTSKQGCIEATHDNEADILLIEWETVEGNAL